jgi:phytoene synthase
VPPGSTRYWSWLFAAREAREPLLGIYALMAEWRALMDPGTEMSVAQTKIVWWREEMDRLAASSPLHPITRYLADFPRAAAIDFVPLMRTVEAAAAQVAGAPLERGEELEAHADALYGQPLLIAALLAGAIPPGGRTQFDDAIPHGGAAQFGGARGHRSALDRCVATLAAAEYLTRAIADYAREARAGRIPFAVDELLAAEIENNDLVAAEPPPRLRAYLNHLRQRAAGYYSNAAAALAPEQRPPQRHLLVLAALGAKHLSDGKGRSGADFRLADLYNAWNAARRAAAAR